MPANILKCLKTSQIFAYIHAVSNDVFWIQENLQYAPSSVISLLRKYLSLGLLTAWT